MAEKAMLVPVPGDGPLAREVLAEVGRLMESRKPNASASPRPLGSKLAKDFADRLRQARYLDQQDARRTG